ncbi:MAG: RNA polymerase sigma factor [Acidimicrobiia bacterium]|nr:RNA polymerase sigma factor [Acidimicrobiia bacterium]
MREEEIKEAYREHKDALYRFAWRMTGAEGTAEDLVQECFLGLVRNPNGFEAGRADLRGYLFGAVRNQARKHWRREQRWEELDEKSFAAAPVDVTKGEKAALVGEAVRALPALQREALLRRWEAPGAPARLEGRIFSNRRWYEWLWKGSVRVPVPAMVALVIVLVAGIGYLRRAEVNKEVRLTDFQPVAEMKTRIIRREL